MTLVFLLFVSFNCLGCVGVVDGGAAGTTRSIFRTWLRDGANICTRSHCPLSLLLLAFISHALGVLVWFLGWFSRFLFLSCFISYHFFFPLVRFHLIFAGFSFSSTFSLCLLLSSLPIIPRSLITKRKLCILTI